MEDPFINFLIGILALTIGILLFFVRKMKGAEKSVDSWVILILIMSATSLTIPLLAQYKGGWYYFSPIYILAVNGWLFFAKNVIIGKDNWLPEKDKAYNQVRRLWFFLMGVFFVITIFFVVYIPLDKNLALH
jgi:hypothetical protein